MPKVREMTVEDIEQIVEHKLLEILGDPDSGLHLKKEFKAKLEQRLKKTFKKNSPQRGIEKICLRLNGKRKPWMTSRR